VTTLADGWDDEELLAALQQVFDSQREPPPEVVDAGKQMFAWHAIGNELAQLTYDSADERELATRTETAEIRAVTFSSVRLTIELEFTADAVLGRAIPSQVTRIMVQFSNGRETDVAVDATGCFSIRPTPPAAFRLRCQTDAGPDILTGWVTP
jgi:hypothetical protein